jgi:hypothetical protein
MCFVRAVLIALYPLFGPALFKSLRNNVAGSVLAAIATGYCFVAFALWRYGARLRARSPWVKKSKEKMQRSEEIDETTRIDEVG